MRFVKRMRRGVGLVTRIGHPAAPGLRPGPLESLPGSLADRWRIISAPIKARPGVRIIARDSRWQVARQCVPGESGAARPYGSCAFRRAILCVKGRFGKAGRIRVAVTPSRVHLLRHARTCSGIHCPHPMRLIGGLPGQPGNDEVERVCRNLCSSSPEEAHVASPPRPHPEERAQRASRRGSQQDWGCASRGGPSETPPWRLLSMRLCER
jgi:hypothetical protein